MGNDDAKILRYESINDGAESIMQCPTVPEPITSLLHPAYPVEIRSSNPHPAIINKKR